jgi:lipopolysaccharide transport system permease protein
LTRPLEKAGAQTKVKYPAELRVAGRIGQVEIDRLMKEQLREFWEHRELLYMIVYRDIKVRYKQSVMGFLWAILMPILIVMSGIVVRYGYALAVHKPLQTGDLASVAVKSLPWAFLISSIRFAGSCLTNNVSLVTKIYFPKEIFPIGSVLACLFDFFVASVALVILLVVLKIGWSLQLLWIPLLLLIMIIFAAGIGMIVSAASLFFRDVKYIVEVILTFGIFFTPVFYDVSMFGRRGKWLMLNPVAPILDGLSACIVHHQSPGLFWFAYSTAFGLFAFVAGYLLFKHLEPAFAESI